MICGQATLFPNIGPEVLLGLSPRAVPPSCSTQAMVTCRILNGQFSLDAVPLVSAICTREQVLEGVSSENKRYLGNGRDRGPELVAGFFVRGMLAMRLCHRAL